MTGPPPTNSMFRILIATDIHLGYAEKDAIRGEDTFKSFEEVLQIAQSKEVDFILLGGDLFHENKPSSKCMTKCVELLRKYCMGDNPVKFAVVSNQKDNFSHSSFPVVNYEDENLNISMPVFSIHGNHDDPIGKEPLCSLETLSAAGLINYFGKYMDMDHIDISPILMKKDTSKLALYGFGAIPEERLSRFFLQNKINFLLPAGDGESWFKIFVVHQNRNSHSGKFLPEKYLSNLPDLVIWGHEHESFDHVDWNPNQMFYVYQPGSTVITSLCQAESKQKHVGLLEVFSEIGDNKFRITHIPLETPRKLYFEDINIDEIFAGTLQPDEENVMEYCVRKVEEMLITAAQEHSGDDKQPKLPLIRIRVQMSNEYHTFSSYQFGQRFVGKVANPKEMVLFKTNRVKKFNEQIEMDFDRIDELMEADNTLRCNIEDVIKQYFEDAEEKSKLNLLCEMSLTEGVKAMVEKDASSDTLSSIIDLHINDVKNQLEQDKDIDLDDKSAIVAAFRKVKNKSGEDKEVMMNKLKEMFRKYDPDANGKDEDDDDEEEFGNGVNDDDEDEDLFDRSTAPVRGRGKGSKARGGRGKGRGARGASTSRGGRSNKKRDYEMSPPESPPSSRRGSRSSPRAKKQSIMEDLVSSRSSRR